jgi:AAA family ATP:ADP antiporter
LPLPSLESLFPVRKGERKLALLLFFHSLFAVGAFVASRAVRDALFLAYGGDGQLAWMYVASAGAVAICGIAYSPLAARFRRDQMALFSALGFASVFLVAWVLEEFALAPGSEVHRRFIAGLYVYVEVMGALSLVQFWTLANELFHAREAKRLYGLIASGGTLSNVIVGLIAGRLATAFGAGSVLLFCAVLLVGTAAASFFAGRTGRQRMFARKVLRKASRSSVRSGASTVLRSEHLRAVALLAALTFFTTTIVDYQFKVHAGATYEKDALAAYFSYFYAFVGVLAVCLQLFGTGRVMARAGVVGALAILPLSLGLGSVALAIVPVLWAAALTKGADTLFRYSVNDATTQLLYLPVSAAERASSKAFIDSGVKQLAIAGAGLALIGYRALFDGPEALAWLGVALCVAWGLVVLRLRSQYVRQLQDTLRRRRFDVEQARNQLQSGASHGVLRRALESDDPEEVLNGLELLPVLENIELDHRVEPLLEHPLPAIRIAALRYYAKRQTLRFANSVFRRFDDPEPTVRAAAVAAFCGMGRDKSVKNVRQFLGDPDAGIRGAAITGMIRFGGLDGVLMAAGALKELIAHSDPKMREHAAKVLGAIGVKNFYQPVLELMNDPDPAVRRQAILSAGQLQSPEFVLPLLYKTGASQTGREAIEALAAYGAPIAPTLGKVLGNRLESPAVRRGVARVLGRLASEAGAEIITRHLDEQDEELRTQLFRALARAVRANRLLNVDTKMVSVALVNETMRAYRALAAAEALGLSSTPAVGSQDPAELLSSALQEKVAKSELRIFLLLSVLYPEAGMEHIYAGIGDRLDPEAPRRRANAVELLDNLLARGLKAKLLPLLDDLPRAQKLEAVFPDYATRKPTPEQASAELCRDETAWVRACATWHAAKAKLPHALTVLESGTSDPSPLVREVAIVCAVELSPEHGRRLAETRTQDEAIVVRRQATWLVTSAA